MPVQESVPADSGTCFANSGVTTLKPKTNVSQWPQNLFSVGSSVGIGRRPVAGQMRCGTERVPGSARGDVGKFADPNCMVQTVSALAVAETDTRAREPRSQPFRDCL